MAQSFHKLFMLDIETTGVDPLKEEVLQIAVLEMNFEQGLWKPGRKFNFYQHTDRLPESKFAQENMAELYSRCRNTPHVSPSDVRKQMLEIFEECEARPPNIFFCGWNAGIFDLPFLAHHGYFFPAKYENDKLKGDCHYRVYEISGALQLAANTRGHNEINSILKEATKLCPEPSTGNRHEAMFDCERQLQILNGLILLMRTPPVGK